MESSVCSLCEGDRWRHQDHQNFLSASDYGHTAALFITVYVRICVANSTSVSLGLLLPQFATNSQSYCNQLGFLV